jgi:hypothetical protein
VFWSNGPKKKTFFFLGGGELLYLINSNTGLQSLGNMILLVAGTEGKAYQV